MSQLQISLFFYVIFSSHKFNYISQNQLLFYLESITYTFFFRFIQEPLNICVNLFMSRNTPFRHSGF